MSVMPHQDLHSLHNTGLKGSIHNLLINPFPARKVNNYSKTCLKRPLKKKINIGFPDQLWLNAGQKYCRMLQREHSAILLTCIKLPFVIKIFVLSIFE